MVCMVCNTMVCVSDVLGRKGKSVGCGVCEVEWSECKVMWGRAGLWSGVVCVIGATLHRNDQYHYVF